MSRPSPAPEQGAPPEPHEVEVRTSGGLLRGDLYSPGDRAPVPLLVAASPYQKELRFLPTHPAYPFRETGPIELYLRHGYAYLWLDVPGSGRSEGDWDPVSRAEGEAIAEVVEWAANEPWCSGSVGMIGQSYFCWSAWNTARVAPPHLRTVVAFDGSCDLYRDWMYKGGIPDLGFASSWAAALLLQHQATGKGALGGGRERFLPEMYEHSLDDEWHRRRSPFWELDKVSIPVLSIGNWAKLALHLRGNVEGFRRLGGPKRLVVLPAATPNEVQALYASDEFHEREILPWYDRYLKSDDSSSGEPRDGLAAPPGGPPVKVFVNRAGRWREAEDWPPPGTARAQWLLSGETSGTVSSLNDGSLVEGPAIAGAESFSWSYPDPLWRIGTSSFDERGAPDHLARVATFTSEPMQAEREFTGDGFLELYASSDQPDLDVVVSLYVLEQPGAGAPPRQSRVSQGWLRASHRAEDPELTTEMRPFQTHREPVPIEPGEVVRLRVPLRPMSFAAHPGERLRLSISNGDSPMLEGRLFQWYGLKVGTDSYHHSGAWPSRLVLPEQG